MKLSKVIFALAVICLVGCQSSGGSNSGHSTQAEQEREGEMRSIR